MYSLRKRRSLLEKAKSEPEADWRRFFLEVQHKRAAARTLAKMKPKTVGKWIESEFLPVKHTGKKAAGKKEGRGIDAETAAPPALSRLEGDLAWLRGAWPKLVGADVAEETDVFAFKNGVVTVVVYAHALLQEIRQFHKETILHDLRDIWQGSMPLVDVVYRVGVRKEC